MKLGTTTSGVYTVDIDGDAGTNPPIQVYCDQETDGGGWMQIMKLDGGIANYAYESGYQELELLNTNTAGTAIMSSATVALFNKDMTSMFRVSTYADSPMLPNTKVYYSGVKHVNTRNTAVSYATQRRMKVESSDHFDYMPYVATSSSYAYCVARATPVTWNTVGTEHVCINYVNAGGGFWFNGGDWANSAYNPGYGTLWLRTHAYTNPLPHSCNELFTSGATFDGTYEIDVDGDQGILPFQVYCDMNSDDGGWTLIHKNDISSNIDRNVLGYNFFESLQSTTVNEVAIASQEIIKAMDPDYKAEYRFEATSGFASGAKVYWSGIDYDVTFTQSSPVASDATFRVGYSSTAEPVTAFLKDSRHSICIGAGPALSATYEHICIQRSYDQNKGIWLNGGVWGNNGGGLSSGGRIWMRNPNIGSFSSLPTTCSAVKASGFLSDGVYDISPNGWYKLSAFCDMTSDDGGWMLIRKNDRSNKNDYVDTGYNVAALLNNVVDDVAILPLSTIDLFNADLESEFRMEITAGHGAGYKFYWSGTSYYTRPAINLAASHYHADAGKRVIKLDYSSAWEQAYLQDTSTAVGMCVGRKDFSVFTNAASWATPDSEHFCTVHNYYSGGLWVNGGADLGNTAFQNSPSTSEGLVYLRSEIAALCPDGFFGLNCDCEFPILSTTTSDPAELVSATINNGVLSIVWEEALKYFHLTSPPAIIFYDEDGNEDASADSKCYTHFTFVNDVVGCNRRWTASADVTKVIDGSNGCIHSTTLDTDSNSDVVLLRFAVLNNEVVQADGDVIDTIVPNIHRELVHHLPLELSFPRATTVEITGLTVYSEVVTARALVNQAVVKPVASSGNDGTATIDVFTSVQYPFQLKNPVNGASLPTGILYSSVSDISSGSEFVCSSSGGNCDQLWSWTFSDNSNRCNFDGQYSIVFDIGCVEGYTGECSITDGERTVTVTMTLDTDNHCANVVQTVNLVSEMASFTSTSFDTPKDEYIDQDSVVFRARVRSADVSLVGASWKTIHVADSSDGSGSINVDIVTGGTATGSLSHTTVTPVDATGSTDETADPSSNTAWLSPYFTVNIDTRDLPVDTRSTRVYHFSGVLDISYATSFTATSAERKEGSTLHTQRLHLTSVSYSTRSVEVGKTVSINNEGTSSSSSTEGIDVASSSNMILFGVCAVALVALIAAVIAVRRGRKPAADDSESSRV